jgi:hypothetical protein
VLAIKEFSDQGEDGGLDDGPIFFLSDPDLIFYYAISQSSAIIAWKQN